MDKIKAQTYNLQLSAGTPQINICFMPQEPQKLHNILKKDLSWCLNMIKQHLSNGLGITIGNNIYITTSN